MINQKAWLRTRRKLLDAVKTQVRLRLGQPSRSLDAYARAIEADYRGPWRVSSADDLAAAVAGARVVLGADFHAYAQSQRAFVRVLRDEVRRPNVVLALECVDAVHDGAIARYLAGRMSEERFLKVVRWDRDWGFPFANYRPFFELARDRGYRIVGLNNLRLVDLRRRDAWAAARVLELTAADPSALVFVVIGEWHLAGAHLPARLKAKLRGRGEVVTIFQDVERIYFGRAARGGAAVDVVRASRDRYCQMVSPPWMKWQSYLMYLEQAYDRDLQEDLGVDYSDHVASLVQVLEADLGVETRKSRLQVFCPNSRDSLARLKMSLPKRFAKVLVYHLERDLSFFFPERDWLYLSRATINHASGLAGQFVHAHLCRRKRALWDLPKDFLALTWIEAVGFFFSKWINPRRKAETLESLRVQLAARQPRDHGRRALLLALDQRLSEVVWTQTGRVRALSSPDASPEAYLEAARIVGHMLGERLFQRVRSRVIGLPTLMSYLKINVEGKEFADVYWRLIRELEGSRDV